MFLNTKSVYWNDFEGSCAAGDWKIQFWHHKNKLYLKIYKNLKQLLKIVIIFHNITVFTVFYIN